MDALNHINLAWIPALILACSLIGVGIGLLLNRGHDNTGNSTWKEEDQ